MKNNKKLIIGFILGSLIFSAVGVTAATLINGKEVTYDNTNSKLESTNVQEAIDELNNKTKLKNRGNIVEAYTYNQTSGATNYCVTGDEDTCVETKCHKNTTAGSCPAGTIIVYKVNENETVRFHVMYDNGSTLTMQSQRNTIYSIAWYGTVQDYKNSDGPLIVLAALEGATVGWDNVNNQTYTMGTTEFKTNAYTGCTYSSCDENIYTLNLKTTKSRMITLQEAKDLGCTTENSSCPIWMYNYLYNSVEYGGTKNDVNVSVSDYVNNGYWLMNALSTTEVSLKNRAWFIRHNGVVHNDVVYNLHNGARAVVEINK